VALSTASTGDLEVQRGRWWVTLSTGDLDGFLDLFAEDAVWVTPDVDEIQGREAIRAYWQPVLAQCEYEFTVTSADVRVAGRLAIERARFTSQLKPRDPTGDVAPEPLRHDGRYLMYWRWDAASGWRVTRYADVSSEL
jgi:uncharacterized protein (TIGR02246 family)